MSDLSISSLDCTYTSCYCEENVWKLLELVRSRSTEQLHCCYAVFISNLRRQVPLFEQKCSQDAQDGQVVWDYHVLMVYKPRSDGGGVTSWVYDLDTRLGFPCSFSEYSSKAIRSDGALHPKYRRLFRVVPAEQFLNTFASDRSHMLRQDHTYMSTPPDYPCIQTKDCSNNIQSYINMSDLGGDLGGEFGMVVDLPAFSQLFSDPDASDEK